jgi:hypothetical protein
MILDRKPSVETRRILKACIGKLFQLVGYINVIVCELTLVYRCCSYYANRAAPTRKLPMASTIQKACVSVQLSKSYPC